MKKTLALSLVLLIAACFATADVAEAVYVNIYNMPYVYSPDSDYADPGYTPPTTDDAFLNQFGSLRLGMPFDALDTFTQPDGFQTAGIYGVGTALPFAYRYNIGFDYHLRTYDSSAYDTFRVVITEGDYLWNGGIEVGGWAWGGLNFPGLESLDAGYALRAQVNAIYGTTYYLNAVMVVDGSNISWGRFSDVNVESVPTPEPATMLLLGSGLVGLAGYGRKRMKK